ncbi:helix-turn-helix domain-containing protein [Amycolatopsis acidicola]|uniref:Helix-turn-helix domain-containing protein n=1 Tax=Amycolatopsis acidicola TaxID=2596893 RepID=A0A5N0V895_9PSEU|nr:helix-turn-helix domain-containing protein [Amycolatopsis acidicola]
MCWGVLRQSGPIGHVAAEMGISRQCASKWVNRYRQFGDAGLPIGPVRPIASPPQPLRPWWSRSNDYAGSVRTPRAGSRWSWLRAAS